MSDWSSGYVTDIDYTHGYYWELNPLRLKLPFLYSAYQYPEIKHACELGFGQGVSLNIHAAASTTEWSGTDFNPSQAGFAQELAVASGSGANLFDQSFADFAQRDDLPGFDYIGLHGIWSWISDQNRQVLIDFIAKKLNIGGILYISYNTMPGFAYFAPMRHLMNEHINVFGKGAGITHSVDQALLFAQQLLETNPIFSRANTAVPERLKQVSEQNRHYLAHEYFNKDWHPLYFSQIAQSLEAAKLNFVCSAHYNDLVPVLNLTVDQQNFLNQISDPVFKETIKDFMINSQFRRDYWVKGPRKLNDIEKADAFKQLRFVMTVNRSDANLLIKGAIGEAQLTEAIYTPILDCLSDHQIKSASQIDAYLQSKNQNLVLSQLIEAMLLLNAKGYVAVVQDETSISKARRQSDKLNSYFLNKARGDSDVGFLASPVTGGGCAVGRFQQLFLLAMKSGKKNPQDLAQFVWQFLKLQGQLILKDGKKLETEEENLAELLYQAQEFSQKQLPILKALHIA
jgi:methyltransferase-like protein